MILKTMRYDHELQQDCSQKHQKTDVFTIDLGFNHLIRVHKKLIKEKIFALKKFPGNSF